MSNLDIIEYIQKINNDYLSDSKKDTELYNIKKEISRDFENTLDYESETLVNGEKQELTVIKTKDDCIKKVIAKPNEKFLIGDTIDCYDYKWMITSVDANSQIYCVGKMTLCPYVLRFQDSKGVVHEYPYYIYSGTSTLDKSAYMVTPDGNRRIVLALDNITRDIMIDRRFMGAKVGNIYQCWKVTDVDVELNYGLLTLVLERDRMTPNDNVEKGIADYVEEKLPMPTNPKSEIIYNGLPEIKVGGSEKTFTAKFYNIDGTLNDSINAIWNLEVPLLYQDKIIITGQTAKYIKIKALYDTKIIGIVLNLEL